MRIIQFINLGGSINWAIVLLFLWALVVIIERSLFFIETRKGAKRDYLNHLNVVLNGEEKKITADLKNKIEKEISKVYFDMNRGLWVLNFISAIAPSLGLLGTVTGLIGTFKVISTGTAQIAVQDFSTGIWEAMLTTAFGMVVSIPTLFFYRLFKRIIEKRLNCFELLLKDYS